MDIMELGAIGELVGGVAVVGSLIFVGLQVRQGTRAQNTVAADAAIDRMVGINNAIATDGELARIFGEGSADLASLQPAEYTRYHLVLRNIFEQFDAVGVKREARMVPDSLWHSRRSSLKRQLATQRGTAQWWERNAKDFSPAFRAFVANEMQGDAAAPAQDAPRREGR